MSLVRAIKKTNVQYEADYRLEFGFNNKYSMKVSKLEAFDYNPTMTELKKRVAQWQFDELQSELFGLRDMPIFRLVGIEVSLVDIDDTGELIKEFLFVA